MMLGNTLRVATLAALTGLASGQCTTRVFGEVGDSYVVAADATVATKDCANILVGHTGTASSTCTGGAMTTVSGCTAVQCTTTSDNAGGKWTSATNLGAVMTLDCLTYDAKYATGANAINSCIWDYTGNKAVWSTTPNVEDCVGANCAQLVENSLTWPAANNGADSSLGCEVVDSAAYAAGQNAVRTCT